jgi:hypothetical protein
VKLFLDTILGHNLPQKVLLATRDCHAHELIVPTPVTPEEYAKYIYNHAQKSAKNSLYPGDDFQWLATFLNQSSGHTRQPSRSSRPALFASLYLLQGLDQAWKDFPSGDLQSPERLQVADDYFYGNSTGSVNQILFLRGYPTPEWLRTLGSYFFIDAEFFRQHLEFNLFPYKNMFSAPSLPSSSSNIVRLRVTSLGLREMPVSDITSFRQECRESMAQFEQRLGQSSVDVGTSIVRRFSVHTAKYFSFEQDISIWYRQRGRGWIGKCPLPD